jgi:hypothetical protein
MNDSTDRLINRKTFCLISEWFDSLSKRTETLDNLIKKLEELREEGYSKIFPEYGYSSSEIVIEKEWLETDEEFMERQKIVQERKAKAQKQRRKQYEELKKEFGE